jgi:hypothetical protein
MPCLTTIKPGIGIGEGLRTTFFNSCIGLPYTLPQTYRSPKGRWDVIKKLLVAIEWMFEENEEFTTKWCELTIDDYVIFLCIVPFILFIVPFI